MGAIEVDGVVADGHRRRREDRRAADAKIVSGVDDHSRFCISARVVVRATARPTCDALALAMRTYGCPAEILTDNGKVFTGRFGPGTGEVLFDRICRENGIKHILTKPRSPTTTGKVERWHKTLRVEFLNGRVFDSIEHAQAELDVWVEHYNHDRPHQGIGMVAPWERFRLAKITPQTYPPWMTRRRWIRAGSMPEIGHTPSWSRWDDQLRRGEVSGRGVARR